MQKESTKVEESTSVGNDAKLPVSCCADDENDSLCPRCQCCDTDWVECWDCGGEGGQDGEELMMEDPLWYSPDDFRRCSTCKGKGGWSECIGSCDENGKHSC